MKLPSILQGASVVITTAAAGAVASFAAECPNWHTALTGAGVAFVASVLHLYQAKPVAS